MVRFRSLRPLALTLLLGSIAPSLRAAPGDEGFDGVPLSGGYSLGNSPRTISQWTLRLIDAGGADDPAGEVDVTNVSSDTVLANNGGDQALKMNGPLGVTTAAQFASVDSSTFRLVGFRIDNFMASANGYRVVGYLDGNPVASASLDFTAPPLVDTLVTVSGTAWNNLDEFRIVRQDGSADVSFYLDDIDVEAAIVPDTTAPAVSSIARLTPAGETLSFGVTTVTYRVTFSESVSGVDVADFALTATGTASGSIASVSAAAGTVIDVSVNTLSGAGTLRLDLNSSGTSIEDAATNAIASGFTSGQTYTLPANYAPVAGLGGAIQFEEAREEGVQVPDHAALDAIGSGSFTVEAWVKRAASGGSWYTIAGKQNPAAGTGWYFRFDGDRLSFYALDGGAANGVTTDDTIADTDWHHVAAVLDADALTTAIYIDGVLSKSVSFTTAANITNNVALGLGMKPGYSESFDGSLDEVRIWNTARSLAQIREYLRSPLAGTEAGLVGYWNFEEGAGTTVLDRSANANHGTLQNSGSTAEWIADGAIPYSVTLDEDSPAYLRLGGSDLDNQASITTRVMLLPAHGILAHTSDGATATGAVGVGESLTDVGGNPQRVIYVPDANFTGADSFTYQVNDGTTNSTNTVTVALTFTALNDAPTAIRLTQAVAFTEDGGATALNDIVVSDGESDDIITVTLTLSDPTGGQLSTGTYGSATSTFNAGTGVWTVTGGIADVNAALAAVTFAPAANRDLGLTITTRVRDAADTGPVDGTITLTATTVNDAPTITDGVVTPLAGTDENSASTATTVSALLAAVGHADVDSGAVAGIAITGLTGLGHWQYSTDGVTWTNLTVAAGDAAPLLDSSSRVRYVPAGQNAEAADFTFRAWDRTSGSASIDGTITTADSTTAGSTTAFSTGTATAMITVTDVAEAPTDLTLSNTTIDQSADANAVVGVITATDPDAADSHTFELVAGSGDTDNASFNVSASNLRATDPSAMAGGVRSVRLRATDVDGLTYEEAFTLTVVDDVAPAITISAVSGDDLLNDAETASELTISGTTAGAEDGRTVTVTFNSQTYAGTVATNAWSVTVPAADLAPLTDGGYAVAADVSDAAGNAAVQATRAITVDRTAPAAPAITGVSTDAGPSNSDGITNDATPTFSGTAEAGSTVEVFRDGASLGTATADGAGGWTLTAAAQVDGTYTITATATDAAGTTGSGSAGFSYTLDTAAPAASAIVRQDPAGSTATTTSVTFRITFDDAVAGVDSGDFALTTSGVNGAVTSVSAVSGTNNASYDVVVGALSGSGTLRLDLNAGGTGITDTAGNAITGGFTTGESYTVDTTAQFPIVEDFDGKSNADLTTANWLVAGSATGTGTVMRLTQAANSQAGSIIYDRAFNSTFGVNVQFDYTMGGGTGADGLAFFLIDGATSSPAPGGVGHALGYAYNGAVAGATQGYMGVAFDRFGNFANADPVLFHDGAAAMLQPNTIAIRGPATVIGSNNANQEYDYVAGSATSYSVEGTKKVNLTVSPTGRITLRISSDDGATWTSIYNDFDFAGTSAYSGYATPGTFKLGFAASTGGQNNEHTVDNLLIRKPVDIATTFTAMPIGMQKVGDPVSYTLTVANRGPNDDPAVALSYSVPAAITDVTWSYTIGGTGTGNGMGAGNTVAPTLDLPNGATATITVNGTLGAAAVGQTLAHVAMTTPSAPFGDTNPANDSATASTSVYHTPVITSALTAAGTYGTAFSYTVTATAEPASLGATGLPSGLTLNATTGAITGTPAQAGTFNVSLTGTNSGGTGSASVLALTIAKVPLTVTANDATREYGTANPDFGLSYTGFVNGDTAAALATAPSATTTATASSDVGTYPILPAGGASPNYTFTYVDGTLTVSAAAQTITFPAIGTVQPGAVVALDASSSSGLPVTFSVVSGDATVSGSTLSVQGSGSIVVRASQAGDANHQPASVTQTVTSSKLSQTITFTPLADRRADAASFALSATASSGLPVSFAVTSGPAMLDGTTVTLTGVPGTVVITASQPGNATYAAAANVNQSFDVAAVGPLVYFGTLGSETIAASVRADGTAGTMIGRIPGTGEAFILDFTINPDGTWIATAEPFANPETAGSVVPASAGPRAASTHPIGRSRATGSAPTAVARTFRGVVQDGVLSGTIDELDLSFTAALEPPTGATAPLAGYYAAPSINSATGGTYSVVGTRGDIYVLVITSSTVAGSAGEVSTDGSFRLENANTLTIIGAVNAPTTSVTGTIIRPDGETEDFSGVRDSTLRTDRLINLSTRARFTGSQHGALITGFVIGGSAPKQVLLRGVGPSLAAFGVAQPLSDPRLRVFNAAGSIVAENNDWDPAPGLADAMSRTGAFSLAAGSRDAALLLTLAPGAYTMHVLDGGESGVALAEIYDASENAQTEYQRLINISSRGVVATGDGVLIAGFVVTGNAPKRVLVRGAGPSLAGFGLAGVLADPQLALFDRQGGLIARNDNWEAPVAVLASQASANADAISAANAAAGAFSFDPGSRDAALIVTLAPGAYTAHVTARDSVGGHALIEVYELAE